MTLTQRKRFMRELTANVLKEALAKAELMPSDWDGHELRRYLADKFADAAFTLHDGTRDASHRRRLREYRNTVLTLNL